MLLQSLPGLPFWAQGPLGTVALLLLLPQGSLGQNVTTTTTTTTTCVNCTAMRCNNPVVENGVQITGLGSLYTYNRTVAFECKIGYFMIGSYVTRCGSKGIWKPPVPTCKKITPNLCGAPLIPTGSVHPLRHEYVIGASIIVHCNPHYCFPDATIEKSAVCDGYNRWEPPVHPCFLRTSPDTVTLKIPHGRIVRGKKRQYEPGDKVSVHCHAGYALKGPSVIRYVGGNKWLPKLPSCTLSVFFILLIIACVLIILLLVVKMIWKDN